GTKIRSISNVNGGCKRIAVFSGSGRISVSCDGLASSSDNYIVQAFPKNAWGKRYLTVPTGKMPTNFYRICVLDPATSVRVNGLPVNGLINGFYYEIKTDKPTLIESSLPVMVAQVITSQGECGNGTPGDPEVIYLSPVEQNIDKVIFNSTSNFNISQHWVNVVIKAAAVPGFRLDGASVSGSFSIHPQDPAYLYAQINLQGGQHTIAADSGFNAIAYGFGPTESYGYNAGTNVKDLYQFVSIQNQFATVNFPASCSNTPFYFSMTFPYEPTSIRWVFNGLFQDVTVNRPAYDSTWNLNGRQVYRYKLPTPYSIATVGTYPIKVIAQSPTIDGCGAEQEINYDLQIFAQPQASFDFLTRGCVSEPVSFTDKSAVSGRPINKWDWSFGDGATSNLQSPSHTYTSTGVYTASLRVITDIGCVSNPAMKDIGVPEFPVASFTVTGPLCEGAALSFADNSSSPASSIATWSWNFGDNTAPVVATAGTTQTHIYTSAGTYSVSLEVQTMAGCTSTVFVKTIAIGRSPLASFTFSNGCLPQALVQFTDASAINGAPQALSYVWNFGDGGVSTLQNPSHVFTTLPVAAVSLRVTTAGGCSDDTNRIMITVYEQPLARFAVTRPEACLGEEITFSDSNSLASGSTIMEWQWNFGDGTAPVRSNSGVAQKHTYANPGAYTATLVVVSAAGCSSIASSKLVQVVPPPVAAYSISLQRCAGTPVLLSSMSLSNGGSIIAYKYYINGVLSSTNASFSFTPAAPGNYKLRLWVQTDKGCTAETSDSSVVIHALPVARFGLPENCVDDPLSQFSDSSTVAGGQISAWLWNFGDPGATVSNPNSSRSQNGSHKYSAATSYTVSLIATSTEGCSNTKTELFTINGSLPLARFSLTGGSTGCVNQPVQTVNNSVVDVGKIVKIQIFWDDLNSPGITTIDADPQMGEAYNFIYPSFFTPASKTYQIRMRSYSGDNCFNDATLSITLSASPQVLFTAPAKVCADTASFMLLATSNNLPGVGIFT
ncbi:MAG: PKD domain-containing protein, partial [Chitinophagaceae bacterium]